MLNFNPLDAIQSSFFKDSQSRAQDLASDPKKAAKLVEEAMKKAEGQGGSTGPLSDVWDNLQALLRFIGAYFNGTYRKVGFETIVLALGGVIYFVLPADLVPDVLVGIGLLDDAAVLGFVLNALRQELDRFKVWEKTGT